MQFDHWSFRSACQEQRRSFSFTNTDCGMLTFKEHSAALSG
jgi:hypothetical protein